jgi:hypothetical protein
MKTLEQEVLYTQKTIFRIAPKVPSKISENWNQKVTFEILKNK